MKDCKKLNKMAKTIEDKTADAIEMSNYNAAITAGENGFTMDIRRIGEFYYELKTERPIEKEILMYLPGENGMEPMKADWKYADEIQRKSQHKTGGG